MTTYYVYGGVGSDGNAGTSAGAAWATIDKATSTAVAGDTVYIAGGYTYRESAVHDNSGSSGSPITFIVDYLGEHVGPGGPAFMSAYASENVAPTRASCLDLNGKQFIVWKYMQFIGGTSWTVGNTSNASHIAYEGVEFHYCLFQVTEAGDYAFRIEINQGATPTGDGLLMTGCRFIGPAKIDWDTNGTANYNLKWRIENCIFVAFRGGYGFEMTRVGAGGANCVGGVTIVGGIFYAHQDAIYFSYFTNTTNISYVQNCRFVLCGFGVDNVSGTTGAIIISNCLLSGGGATVSGNVLWPPDLPTDSAFLFAGFHDYLDYYFYGWSAQGQLFTPIRYAAITDAAIDAGNSGIHTATLDAYGAPRKMGRPSDDLIFYVDGSDNAVGDPNSVWTNDANATDSSISTAAYTNSSGTSSTNYLTAGGTNAPGSGDTITAVEFRVYAKHDSGTNSSTVTMYTDAFGESLGNVTITNHTSFAWTSWTALSTPSGGWTWAKVQELEFKAWKDSGASYINIANIQVRVTTSAVGSDIGAVEANTQPTQNSTDEYEGTYCMELAGAGQFTFWQPVSAASTTITVQAKYDSNYTGTKPQLVVTNIPGVADQTDTMSGGSGSYEQLSVNFTPTIAGFVRVILRSNDTGLGKCFFDDIQVS